MEKLLSYEQAGKKVVLEKDSDGVFVVSVNGVRVLRSESLEGAMKVFDHLVETKNKLLREV